MVCAILTLRDDAIYLVVSATVRRASWRACVSASTEKKKEKLLRQEARCAVRKLPSWRHSPNSAHLR